MAQNKTGVKCSVFKMAVPAGGINLFCHCNVIETPGSLYSVETPKPSIKPTQYPSAPTVFDTVGAPLLQCAEGRTFSGDPAPGDEYIAALQIGVCRSIG